MKKWIFIALLFPVFYATGQPGFNYTYGFEQEQITGSAFANVLLDNDTLVLFGTCYPPATPSGQQALLFVKMDTLGNVLVQKCHLDPDAPWDEYAAAPNYEIIKTSDGGYAITGSNLASDNGLLIKFSHMGEKEFYSKYGTPPNAQNRLIRKVIEIEDGYFLSGTMFYNDANIFLMKVDKQGNFLWEKTYGQAGVTEVPASLIRVTDNHFAIGAGKVKIAPSPPYTSNNTWAKAWLLEVDSLGNVINSTESQLNVQTGLGGLKKMPDGWLYTSAIFELHNQFEFGTRGTIVRTGENINDVQWERVVGTTSTYVNGMVDIEPTPDGHWVAVGQWATPPPPPPLFGPNYIGGSTFKFTSEGDSLWARLDTAFWHPDCGSTNYLGGVAVLPSGSIIAAGYADSYCLNPERSYGWLLKISKDGCIDTLCITTDIGLVVSPDKKTSIFPNPTSGIIHVKNCTGCQVAVFDVWGKLVLQKEKVDNQVDLSDLPNGVYAVRLSNQEYVFTAKIIKSR